MADDDQTTAGASGEEEAHGADDLLKKINDLKQAEEGSVHEGYQQQIQELEQKVKDAEDRALRSIAELKNAQQRMENEKASFAAFANQKLVLQVIEIYENYERLLAHEPEGLDTEWRKGFELIHQQFQKLLESQGVVKLDVKVGDLINPEQHQAMMTDEGPQGQILEVYSQAYQMNGRVIKTAMVKVGKG